DDLGRALADAGGALSSVVRVDQYYPTRDAVAPYHVARKQAFGGTVPPSTSVLVNGLLESGALMDVQAMATTLDSSLVAKPVQVGGIRLLPMHARRRPRLRSRAAGARWHGQHRPGGTRHCAGNEVPRRAAPAT